MDINKRIQRFYRRLTTSLSVVFIVFFAYVLPTSVVFAGKDVADLRLSVSEDTITVGDTFSVILRLKAGTNASSVRLGEVDIPGLQSFGMVGVSNQTEFQSVNGVSKVLLENTHHLVASNVGDYTIGPVSIDMGGSIGRITSNSITVHVRPENDNAGTQQNISGINGEDTKKSPDNPRPQSAPRKTTDKALTDPSADSSPNAVRDVLYITGLTILLGIILYTLAISRSPQNTSAPKRAKQEGEKEPDPLSRESTDNMPTATYEEPRVGVQVFPIDILSREAGKDFYRKVYDTAIKIIQTSTTDTMQEVAYTGELSSDVFTEEMRTSLRLILRECDIGKYAPDSVSRRSRIIKLMEAFNNLSIG